MIDETDKPDEAAEAAGAPEVEATPKPKRASRAKRKPAADAADAAEAATEEKPKPKRASRAKAKADKPAKADAPDAKADKPAAPAKKTTASAGGAKSAEGDVARPQVRAHARYVRSSARKARLVCDHIRGKSVPEARAILAHTPRQVARDWTKLLESAVANAEHNHELVGDDLRVVSVKADEGPTIKRFQPRAMGRATQIRKRTAHLSITLTPKD